MENRLCGQFENTIEKSMGVLNEEQLTLLQKYKITDDITMMRRGSMRHGMMHGMW